MPERDSLVALILRFFQSLLSSELAYIECLFSEETIKKIAGMSKVR